MFPWPVRLLGVWLAGVELLLLAMNAFGWHFSVPGFEEFLRWLGDSLASFFAPLETMLRGVLAWFDIRLPKLSPHWHSVFVLSWMLMGLYARLIMSDGGDGGDDRADAPPLSAPWFRKLLATDLPVVIWAFVCAFVPAATTGTQPLASTALATWPLAGFFLFLGSQLALRRRPVSVPYLAGAVFLAILGTQTTPLPALFGIATTSPGILFLVVAVAYFGAGATAVGLLLGGKTWRERLTNRYTAFGIDIITAYTVALALAAAFGMGS